MGRPRILMIDEWAPLSMIFTQTDWSVRNLNLIQPRLVVLIR
ncbi:hypothetical protein SAMN05444166_1987 [Singulisphaera sp. GP187]|nr:hypothetical protein SAMN05444166_1987 [Singulisphaera sp. GP187]